MSNKTTPGNFVFLAAPFRQRSVALRQAVGIASEKAGCELLPSDQLFAPSGTALHEVREGITRAALVVGDVTDTNANVMWELGYAQALGRPILLITPDPGNIPFDLASTRVVTYQSSASSSSLIGRLTDAIVAILSAPTGLGASVPSGARSQVFFSYSHSDSEYLDRILVHLRPVERSGAINLWSDSKIKAGDRWREEIRKAVGKARVAVLLISADFLASDFIVTDELPPLLAAAEEEGARVIPVITKPSRFLRDDRLARFQALNDPKVPLIRMDEAEREALYAKLAEVVEAEVDLK